MSSFLQVFYVVFSAFIFSAAIPNEFIHFGSPLLGLIALVPLYLALSFAKNAKQAGHLTALHFALVQILSSFWLGYFRDFALFTVGGPVLVYIVVGNMVGRFLHFILQDTRGSSAKRIFLFATTWTLWEWAKSTGFLAYPWGTIVMSAYRAHAITQIMSLTGSFGVSFLFALYNASVAEFFYTHIFARSCTRLFNLVDDKILAKKTFIAVLALFATVILFGTIRLANKNEPAKIAKLQLVQQNADPWSLNSEDEGILKSIELTEKTFNNASVKPDLICFSECVLNTAFPYGLFYYETVPEQKPLMPFIRKIGVPFLIGAPVRRGGLLHRNLASTDTADTKIVGASPTMTNTSAGTADGAEDGALAQVENALFDATYIGTNQYENSSILFNADGSIQDYYGKMQLVPFAELIPFCEYEWMQKFMKFLVGFSDGWYPGTNYTLFNVTLRNGDALNFTTPICFEDAFASVCRKLYLKGSELLLNITNDSWSKTASAEYQHFVIASYRTIELNTTMVRSTNSGYSAVINPYGIVIKDMPIFTSCSSIVDVPIYKRKMTLYARFGEWFTTLLLVMWLLYFANYVLRVQKNLGEK